MKKLKNKIKIWAIIKIFNLYFGKFLYPFERADERFRKLSAYQKAKYLKDVDNWVKSDAYRLESEEILRTYYQELALKPLDDITACGYRLAILMEKDRQKRLIEKQKEFEQMIEVSD